jgi:2-keto-4-pentenoate hydratase/2-oxohepta-3-ene-1,7-dioic acid hydratase in catechol pathway
MYFLTYQEKDNRLPRFGFKGQHGIMDVTRSTKWFKESQNESKYLSIPGDLKSALEQWSHNFTLLKDLQYRLDNTPADQLLLEDKPLAVSEKDISFLSPIPNPLTFRDFYGFEQHVKTARKLRGMKVPKVWYQIPVFYYSNPTVFLGHGASVPYPEGSNEFDFELEIAAVIANGGINIKAQDAVQFIAGFTILNDWSARDIQHEEMLLNLGPAKGKDFATSLGPYLVTPDEIKFSGDRLPDLTMTALKNGKQLMSAQTSDLYHSFPEMIQRASRNTRLHPGEIIGSGTVGGGSIMELRPENTDGWLLPGDTVTLTIEKLGALENRIL